MDFQCRPGWSTTVSSRWLWRQERPWDGMWRSEENRIPKSSGSREMVRSALHSFCNAVFWVSLQASNSVTPLIWTLRRSATSTQFYAFRQRREPIVESTRYLLRFFIPISFAVLCAPSNIWRLKNSFHCCALPYLFLFVFQCNSSEGERKIQRVITPHFSFTSKTLTAKTLRRPIWRCSIVPRSRMDHSRSTTSSKTTAICHGRRPVRRDQRSKINFIRSFRWWWWRAHLPLRSGEAGHEHGQVGTVRQGQGHQGKNIIYFSNTKPKNCLAVCYRAIEGLLKHIENFFSW